LLRKIGILDWSHRRKQDMSAELFRTLCHANRLHCVSQELVNWRGRRLIDCFSLFVPSESSDQTATRIVRNANFMREAAEIRGQKPIAN
jgi:hypothetical protein